MQTIKLTEQELLGIISEEITRYFLSESLQSNQLRDFFNQHGGVDKKHRQNSLSDINDSQIGYFKEFDTPNDAYFAKQKLTASDKYTRMRSKMDMQYLFHIFYAADGTAALVGIDRDTIDTGFTWGGEVQKKISDRFWNNGYNPKTHDNRYADDSDTYYYQSPAKDFGLYKNKDLQNRKNDIKQQKDLMDNERYKNWRQERLKHMRDYLQNHYPKDFERLTKIRPGK